MSKLISASLALPSGGTLDFSYSEPMFGVLLDLAGQSEASQAKILIALISESNRSIPSLTVADGMAICKR